MNKFGFLTGRERPYIKCLFHYISKPYKLKGFFAPKKVKNGQIIFYNSPAFQQGIICKNLPRNKIRRVFFVQWKFHWISKTKYENIENEWVHKKGSPDLISWQTLAYYSLLESWRVVEYDLTIFNLFRCEKTFQFVRFWNIVK